MNTYQRLAWMACLVGTLLALSACQQTDEADTPTPTVEGVGTVEKDVFGLANPAAVYCKGLGYTMGPLKTAAGEDAVCIFPDGNECGQWDFLAGRCGQEYTYCLQQGGIRLEGDANVGTCVFQDGSTCDEFMFFQGECRPGDNPA